MRRYIRLLVILIRANIALLFQYQLNFYVGSISTILWSALTLISITIVTYRASLIGGWNREELYLVQGIYSIIFGFMYLVFVRNFKLLTQMIRMGNIDHVFLRPIDSQFSVSVGQFQLFSVIRIFLGFLILWYVASTLHLVITFFDIVLCGIFILSSIIIIYSIWFAIVTTSIWFIDLFNISEMLFQITSMTRYPLIIFRELSNVLVYILLPLVVVTTVPAQILLHTMDIWLAISSLIFACICFLCARLFWRYALRHYTSASS